MKRQSHCFTIYDVLQKTTNKGENSFNLKIPKIGNSI